jgi:hypothetical protein
VPRSKNEWSYTSTPQYAFMAWCSVKAQGLFYLYLFYVLLRYLFMKPHRRYLYFDVVVGLAWSNDPESYAGGSVATGRVSHAGQVKGDDPDGKGYPRPPGWGLEHGADNSIPIK